MQAANPWLVLADENGSVPERTQNAGRVKSGMGLSRAQWKTFAEGANRIATSVLEQTGLRTVFHHHCAGYVETPATAEHALDTETAGIFKSVMADGCPGGSYALTTNESVWEAIRAFFREQVATAS